MWAALHGLSIALCGGSGYSILFVCSPTTFAVQTLNKFLEQHALKGGDYLLGPDYSYAEVATTPFLLRGAAALPTHRGYSLERAIQQQKAHRFEAWFKVSTA